MGNTTSAVDGSALTAASPRARGSPSRAKGAQLTEEEELLLRGVAEKAVSQLVAAQKEVARLQSREHELEASLAAAQASLADVTARLAAQSAAAAQLGSLLESTTGEMEGQIAALERTSGFQISCLNEQKDCLLRELKLLERAAAATAAASAAAPGGGGGGGGGAASLPSSPRSAAAAASPPPEACAGCGADAGAGAAAVRCGSCKGIVYCSRDCQVSHRPAHRAACEEAEGSLKRAMEKAQRELGDCEETLERMGAYAAFLRRVARPEDALAVQREMAAVGGRVHGEEHPQTLTLTHAVALALEQKGELAGAEPLLAGVLEARRRIHGEVHPLSQRALLALTRVRKDLAARAKRGAGAGGAVIP
jgi:hypothetical protein